KQLLLMSMALVLSFVAIVVSVVVLGHTRVYNGLYSRVAIAVDGPGCARIG
ncbi:Hypothetical protein FKW44_009981, partial [Caligus rogercresseyi]